MLETPPPNPRHQMITTGKPDILEMMLPPSFTARLAERAAQAGLSTVDMAFHILRKNLEDLETGPDGKSALMSMGGAPNGGPRQHRREDLA